MKILLSSRVFWPSIGGLEAVSAMLAREFVLRGHSVKLITNTPHVGAEHFDFPVTRRPSARRLIELHRWCDIVFHNNHSLRAAWPLLFIRRPWFVTHATFDATRLKTQSWANYLKYSVSRFCHSILICQAMRENFPFTATVIPNPYDVTTFRLMPEIPRSKDLVFVGRFVSDKGLFVLLDALLKLREHGLQPGVTLVGDGPERPHVEKFIASHDLSGQIQLSGWQRGEALAVLLNAHKIHVIPSLYEEPFGIVALEGIACGCVPVGSVGGGLRDAIGACGPTFPNGDSGALAKVLAELLTNPGPCENFRKYAPEHLALHTPRRVADRYLMLFQNELA